MSIAPELMKNAACAARAPLYPTLIFDFDGTIANTLSAIVKLFNEHADEFHVRPLADKDVEDLRGMSNRDIIKKYQIPLIRVPSLVLWTQKKLHQRIDQVELFPGIRELILSLKDRNFRLGILTSNSRENVLKLLQARNLDIFDFIHTESTLFGKTRALLRLLKKHGLKNDEVIYVGDETRDIEACQNAGIAVIAVSWGFHRKELLRRKNPTYLVDLPHEIENIVFA